MILGEQEQWKNAEMCAVIYHSAVGDPGDSTTRWASTETQGFFLFSEFDEKDCQLCFFFSVFKSTIHCGQLRTKYKKRRHWIKCYLI